MPELQNLKREKFAQVYAMELNITEGEKAAGLSKDYGYKLLKIPDVRERVLEIQRGTADRMVIGQNQALREACYLAFSDITETLGCFHPDDFQKLPAHVRKAIKSIDITETEIPVGKNENGEPIFGTKRQIKIQMHAKSEPLRLVAQVTGLLDADNRDKEHMAFTGIDIVADITEARKAKQLQQQPTEGKEP